VVDLVDMDQIDDSDDDADDYCESIPSHHIGHVVRGDGQLKLVREGRMEGKRPRSRPRIGMIDDIMMGLYENMKRNALDGEGWRVRLQYLPCGRELMIMMNLCTDCLQICFDAAHWGRSAIMIENYCGIECGSAPIDKEEHTMLVVCRDRTLSFAFHNYATLALWQAAIKKHLGDGMI